jgi:hypothetical protein
VFRGPHSDTRKDLRFCNEMAVFANLTHNVDEDFTGSEAGCVVPELLQRLAIVIFDPPIDNGKDEPEPLSRVMGWEDPSDLAAQYRRALEAVTNGRLRYDVVKTVIVEEFPEKVDQFKYTEAPYRQCLASADSCHGEDAADYPFILDAQGLCENVNNGVIDEVWLFGGPYFGFPLLQRVGPLTATSPWSTLGTSCRRVTDVFGFSYERGLDAMLGGLQGQVEIILEQIYGDWDADRTDTAYHRFESVDLLSSGYSVSGCGGHGYAPNSAQEGKYDSADNVLSDCDEFYAYPMAPDPDAVPDSINCEAWGCTGIGHYRYWLRHLPAAKGTAADGRLADWWRYLLRPDDLLTMTAQAAGKPRVTCSSSYATGWCARVTDSLPSACNVNEWATSHQSTGWVEFSWDTPVVVGTVELYDRACNERVVRGHLEFSDGPSAQPFGALEGLGETPTTIDIGTRQLSWLRVVIDESIGGANPGFGEISIR